MQSKKWSMIEVIVSLFISFALAIFVVQPIVFGMYNIDMGVKDNTIIAIIFTGVSLVRGYVMRRIFNYIHIRYHQKGKR